MAILPSLTFCIISFLCYDFGLEGEILKVNENAVNEIKKFFINYHLFSDFVTTPKALLHFLHIVDFQNK